MKFYLMLLTFVFSSFSFADDFLQRVPTLDEGKECIRKLAGAHPELKDCRNGKGVLDSMSESDPKAVNSEGEETPIEESCSANRGSTGYPCTVYVKCPMSDSAGNFQRFRVEAEVIFRPMVSVVGLDCQLYMITPTTLNIVSE